MEPGGGVGRRVNLEDVARLSGVSRSTVSRVLNGDRRVSAAARARVQAVIDQYGFQPNAAARALASRRTRRLGLLVPPTVAPLFGDPFFAALLRGVADACDDTDQDLSLLLSPAGDAAAERLARRIDRDRGLDGVVIAAAVVDDPVVARLQTDRFPVVLVGRHPSGEVGTVDVDQRAAARAAVAHLLGHGRRRVGIVAGPITLIATIDRYAGYVTAHQEAGRLPDPRLTVHADGTRGGGYLAVRGLLAERPDAVFVAGDAMAVGALRALREAGRRVPDDVALFGFDGLDPAATAPLSLSTVVVPAADLGRAAVRALLRLIEDPTAAPPRCLLPFTLRLGESCGCPATVPGRDGAEP